MANIDKAFTVPALSLEDEVGIFYGSVDPSVSGFEAPQGSLYIRKDVGQLYQKDGNGDTDWTEKESATGGGITESEHRSLDTLLHNLVEDCYIEYTRTNGRVTAIMVWTDNLKTLKIREELITYTNGLVSQIVERQYDGAGALVETKTTVINRTGGLVSSEDVTVVVA